MTQFVLKLTLLILTSAAVCGSCSEAQAQARRGLLYDILHFGRGCGPAQGCSPCGGLEGWISAELDAEKARIREDLRFHRLHLNLHNQDHKKLLHPECNPYHECYWGIYPTCWRQFPGRQMCPPPAPEGIIYEQGPDGHGPYEESLPINPDLFERLPEEFEAPGEPPEPSPLAPEAPMAGTEEPFYFE